MTDQPYYVVKLNTGETLFAEILTTTDTHINLISPLQIQFNQHDKSGEMLFATEWMPYVSQEVFTIPISSTFFIGPISNTFVKFYGSVILQSEIAKIKKEVSENMSSKADYSVMTEGVAKMKELTQKLINKFNLDTDVIDFSEFDLKLEKHKKELVLH